VWDILTPYNLIVHFNNSSLVKTYTNGKTTPSTSINVNIGQFRSNEKQSEVDVNNPMMAPLRPKHVVKYTRRKEIYENCEDGKNLLYPVSHTI
jgi:hypothetical protein